MGKKEYDDYTNFVFVCIGKKCKDDSKALHKAFKHAVEEEGLKKCTKILKVKCTGRCKEAPVAIVGDKWLGKVKPAEATTLVRKAFLKDKS